MRLIVAGSRDITYYTAVKNAIEDWVKENGYPDVILCGMCRGVDSLARTWAINSGIPVAEYPADWDVYKKAAGPIRNKLMAQNADALLAIRGPGKSSGTNNMINTALERGLQVDVVEYNDE